MLIDVDFPGGKQVTANVAGFQVRTDQPKALGGTATAPSPYDLFLASIASCAGIYALGFCDARHIATQGLGLVAHVDLDDATGLARDFVFEITLPEGFPQKYREAILRAVEQCKVKKSIAAGPTFRAVIAQPPAMSAVG